ncbi:hypothetical protein FRC09_009429 [Ceratobasidium sp. 395]|nr:hypothetical protein FRC09_009429 [Ceratobasidium sp. 395]
MSPAGDLLGHESGVVVKSAIVTGGAQGAGIFFSAFLYSRSSYVAHDSIVLLDTISYSPRSLPGLAQDGFSVILNDLSSKSEAGLAAAKDISSSAGQRAIFMAGDVSREEDVDALVQRAVDEFGGLDVMVANAGVCTVNTVMDTTVSEWNLNMNVNALGALLCYRSAARQMIKQGRGGRLIGASTVCAYKGNPTVAAYSASKFAMRGLTQSAGRFCPDHIQKRYRSTFAYRVSFGVCTSQDHRQLFFRRMYQHAMHHDSAQIVSERMQLPKEMLLKGAYSQIPLGYCGQPEDVAGLVSYLASPASHYMTGQIISLDGGMQMF